jgi:DNA-binding MarR family transcriptional regulator
MSLQHELGFPKPFRHRSHETLLNIVLTGTLLVKEGQRIVRPYGITEAQFNILMLLKHQSADGTMSQTALGNMLLVNRSNVTGLIDRMEQSGLVRRAADSGDRRVNKVEITGKGQQVLATVQETYYTRIKEIMSALYPEELNHLCTALERIREQVHRTQKS